MTDPLNNPSPTADREITATRVFDAPRELVWKVWTDPNHLARWWGPRGFTTTTYNMDVKPGGAWRFVMHGPDGTDFQNKITYVEVSPPSRLVYKHGDASDKDVEPVSFTVTVTFDDAEGGRTRMNMQMLFPSAAVKRSTIERYGADKGLVETLARLEEHLVARPFIVSRTFDAPRELVWKAWTERDRLMQWFSPKGFTMSTADLDFRPGGTFLYALRGPDGKEMWGKFEYREIVPPERIVLVNYFSDRAGGVTRHPMAPTWPLRMLTTTTFVEHDGGKTTVTIEWSALNPTPEERKTFDTSHDGMRMGWTGTFEQLEAYLANARN
jgi:uncharacterized protein YndB with AHSA1/START domain